MMKAKVMKNVELLNPAFSNNFKCVTHHQSGQKLSPIAFEVKQ